MKFCPECGTRLIPDKAFCPECGFKLSAGSEPDTRDTRVCPPAEKNGAGEQEPVIQPLMGFTGMGMTLGGLFSWMAEPDVLREFHISSSGGMIRDFGSSYEAKLKNDGVHIRIKRSGKPESSAETFVTGSEFFDRLDELLERYDAASWDGFNKNAEGVYDGHSFSFGATLKDGRKVSARGYMCFPERYGAFRSEAVRLFDELATKK